MTLRHTAAEKAAAKASKQENRRRRAERAEAAVAALLADTPRPIPPVVKPWLAKARRGQVTALVALKCLDCCGCVREEVRLCTVVACPLHPIRPYQPAGGELTDDLRKRLTALGGEGA